MKTRMTKYSYGYTYYKPEVKKDYSHWLVLANIVAALILWGVL
jgi:hypothetical protein